VNAEIPSLIHNLECPKLGCCHSTVPPNFFCQYGFLQSKKIENNMSGLNDEIDISQSKFVNKEVAVMKKNHITMKSPSVFLKMSAFSHSFVKT